MMFGSKLAQLIIAKKVNLWSKKLNVNTNVQMVHVFTGMPNAITLGTNHILHKHFQGGGGVKNGNFYLLLLNKHLGGRGKQRQFLFTFDTTFLIKQRQGVKKF